MKKYLMTGITALAMSGLFTSCTHDMNNYVSGSASETIKQNYENAFVGHFGEPAPTQDWGFGTKTTAATRGMTRSSAVISGDPFTYENTSGYYIETIDESQYNNLSTLSNLNQATNTEWVVTENFPKLNFYEGHHTFYIKGDVTMHSEAYMYDATFYVLKGSILTLNKTANYNTVIYVADGGTLNYNVNKLERNPQGGEKKNAIYNHGTVNLAENFSVSNGSLFYNEGDVYGTNINSAPADNDPSFFYNFGNVELSGNHKLNSDANFFNEGTFTVTGETELTNGNKLIWWINKGTYTTGSFKTAAWNGTMYNFCNMFITGDAYMTNGQFYQMNGSYLEANRGLFNNFQFIMADGSGVNFKLGTKWGQDGADFRGKYEWAHQGFVAVDDNAKVWVRLGGTNYVSAHKGSALHAEGANMIFGYENVIFYEGINIATTWEQANYWNETNAEKLAQSESSIWDLHNVKVYTGDDFKEVTATPKTSGCGATWTPNDGDSDDEIEKIRIIAEDLTVGDRNTDFDFNDVVFDVIWNKTQRKVSIEVLADGAEYKMYIGGTADGGVGSLKEVNEMFEEANGIEIPKNVYPNTDGPRNYKTYTYDLSNDEWKGDNIGDIANSILVRVMKSELVTLEAVKGKAAGKIAVGTDYIWCDEREPIEDRYPKFLDYVPGDVDDFEWY